MQSGHLHHTATRQLRSYDRDEIGLYVHLDRHRSSLIHLQAQRQRSMQNWPEWFASSREPIQKQPLPTPLSWGCTACHESSGWRDRVISFKHKQLDTCINASLIDLLPGSLFGKKHQWRSSGSIMFLISSNNICAWLMKTLWILATSMIQLGFTQSRACSLCIDLEAKGVKEMKCCWLYRRGRFVSCKTCRRIFVRENLYTVPTPLFPRCCSDKIQ